LLRCRRFLARTELFPEAGRQENAPDPVAVVSFMLNLTWFGVVGAFILQEYRTGAFEIGSGWTNLFFLLSGIINCSLLIKSRNSFLFAGAGMGTLGLLFMLEHIHVVLVEKHELIWHLAGEAGEQILLVLGLALAFLSVSALMFLFLWLQAGEKKFWARKALLSTQVTFLTLSLLTMLKPGGLAATPGGMTLALTEHAAMAEENLRAAATLALTTGEGLELTATITNVGAGHSIPTGVTYIRQMWLEVTVTNERGELVYVSGHPDADNL